MFAPSRTCALLFLDTARRSQRCSSSVEAVAKPLRTRPRISFIPLMIKSVFAIFLACSRHAGEACSPQMSVARRSNSAVFSPAAASKALSDRALLRPVLLMAL